MFKRLACLVGVAFAILSGVVTANAVEAWSEYSWQAGGVAILMPGTPRNVEQPLPNGAKVYSAAVDLGAVYYSVSYSRIAKSLLQKDAAEHILDLTQDGAVSNVKGTLRAKRQFTFGGNHAREIVYDTPDKLTLKQRHYIVDDRLLQVTYVGPLNSENQPEVTRFFDSMRFVER